MATKKIPTRTIPAKRSCAKFLFDCCLGYVNIFNFDKNLCFSDFSAEKLSDSQFILNYNN